MPEHLNRRSLARGAIGRANVQLAVLVVIVGVLLISAWIYLSNRPQHPGNMSVSGGSIVDQKMTPVVYAVKDIPVGTVITRDAVMEREIPINKAPLNPVDSTEGVEGRVAKLDISAGQIITESEVIAKKRTARKSLLRHAEEK